MRVGILTFHHAFNYGAFHQTACLVRFLRACGLKPEVINYRNVELEAFHEYCISPGWNPFSWRACNRKKRERFVSELRELPLSPLANRPNHIDWSRYDAVVYGSDEIWNYSTHAHGYGPTYFGAECPDSVKKIAYAPSLGELNATTEIPYGIDSLLCSFHAISARDHNAGNFVERQTGIFPSIVVDPVLLDLSAEDFQPQPRTASDIALVYGEIGSSETVEACRKWAKKNRLKTVSFGFYNGWCDSNRIEGGPGEFPLEIKNASYVLTSTFHGTMFAIRHGIPFFTFRSEIASKKFDPIISSLGLKNRLIPDGKHLEHIPNVINHEDVRKRLLSISAQSQAFLLESLGLPSQIGTQAKL